MNSAQFSTVVTSGQGEPPVAVSIPAVRGTRQQAIIQACGRNPVTQMPSPMDGVFAGLCDGRGSFLFPYPEMVHVEFSTSEDSIRSRLDYLDDGDVSQIAVGVTEFGDYMLFWNLADPRNPLFDPLRQAGFAVTPSRAGGPTAFPPPPSNTTSSDAADAPVIVRTESGKVRCLVSTRTVTCQRQDGQPFPRSPNLDGYRANQASIAADGTLQWFAAQLPATEENHPRNDVVLTYGRIQHLNGWTIKPSATETTFTNARTGHGWTVRVDQISTF